MGLWGKPQQGTRNFTGDLFQRFEGLEGLLQTCRGRTVLDLGMSDGLIGYEFVRHGARLIHGFEKDRDRVAFARRLFRDVPVESHFVAASLAIDGGTFRKRYAEILLDTYDIVLFLGLYHHLKKQMSAEALLGLVDTLLTMAGSHFALRTNLAMEIHDRIEAAGFRLLPSDQEREASSIGRLHVYARSGAEDTRSGTGHPPLVRP